MIALCMSAPRVHMYFFGIVLPPVSRHLVRFRGLLFFSWVNISRVGVWCADTLRGCIPCADTLRGSTSCSDLLRLDVYFSDLGIFNL